MSCHVGIKCLDHQEETGCPMNYGHNAIRDVIKMAPYFKTIEASVRKIEELDTTGYINFGLGLIDCLDWDVDLFKWLCTHGNCNLEIYNEYGDMGVW